jgi:hypothetical protein
VLRVNKNQQLHGATIVAKNQPAEVSVSLVETILRHVAKHKIQKKLVLINKYRILQNTFHKQVQPIYTRYTVVRILIHFFYKNNLAKSMFLPDQTTDKLYANNQENKQ